MIHRRLALALLCACLANAACQRAPSPPGTDGAALPATPKPPNDTPAGQRIETDVLALADDAMEGRGTGTPGYDRAADHVAWRFAETGLEPAGDNGTWFQRVPLLSKTHDPATARMTLLRDGREIRLRPLEQFIAVTEGANTDADIEAPLVFVGHGIHAPELGHDDFAGLDLRGKVAVAFPDVPGHFPPAARAYHASQGTRTRALAGRGAVGWILLPTPDFAAMMPWDQVRAGFARPGFLLADGEGRALDVQPELRVGVMLNITAGDLLFDGSGHDLMDLYAAAKEGRVRSFDLPGTVRISARAKLGRAETRNVVGRLPGSDPALAGEHVVFTAHLDHLGTGEPVDGDRILNGALDNALGVAILLETARELQPEQARPRRSSLFIATAAEEHGLLGARWFVHSPTVPRGSLVANFNLDMPVLTAPSTDVVAVGAEHSTLQAVLEQAAADIGVVLTPDPYPEQAMFVRSDQFAFVRAGIPAVYLTGGVTGANRDQDPKRATAWFLRNCYHRPCDQADLPVHYGDAARLARLNARAGRIAGDAPERPRWRPGNFFGDTFGGAAGR